ncbi:MAG: type II toxin-antitoxin system RelE/ParE family toxin [Isosphaeraceae bacterium]
MAIGPEPRYQLEIAPSALKQLSSLPRKIQERIVAGIDVLRFEPRPHGVKKLSGVDDLYRIRVGNYRVVYTIRDDRLIVIVLRIANRKDAYRGGP